MFLNRLVLGGATRPWLDCRHVVQGHDITIQETGAWVWVQVTWPHPQMGVTFLALL